MFLDYFALGLLIFVALVIFYGIIVIHDIPYEIAKERQHPHQDAIHYAGWVSLFTLHAIWPFLWIWATLWRKERGWGFQRLEEEQHDIHQRMDLITERLNRIQQQFDNMTSPVEQSPAASTDNNEEKQ